jgi:antitoxin component YwqK of YwqJK toxin-antitoxin module
MLSFACPIPEAATEVVSDTWETGDKKSASHLLNGQRVGYRSWNQSGQLDMEYGVKDDRQHGLFRTWHDNGQVQRYKFVDQVLSSMDLPILH